jgi:hypothetical protein
MFKSHPAQKLIHCVLKKKKIVPHPVASIAPGKQVQYIIQ